MCSNPLIKHVSENLPVVFPSKNGRRNYYTTSRDPSRRKYGRLPSEKQIPMEACPQSTYSLAACNAPHRAIQPRQCLAMFSDIERYHIPIPRRLIKGFITFHNLHIQTDLSCSEHGKHGCGAVGCEASKFDRLQREGCRSIHHGENTMRVTSGTNRRSPPGTSLVAEPCPS